MKELMKTWLELKSEEQIIKQKREEVELEMYTIVQDKLPADKQASFKEDEFKLTIKPNYSVKVDQNMASDYAQYFKRKFEMTYSQYRDLDAGARQYVDEIVTINTTKPTFTVTINNSEL